MCYIYIYVESRAMSASMSTYPAGEQMHDREGPFAQATKGARACALGGRLVLRLVAEPGH